MAQQTLNNGESGAVIRGKINDNFTELYGSATNPYPRVANYAALPAASSFTAKIYIVETSTGIWPITRKPAGLWLSDGTNWNWLGSSAVDATEIINTPSGTVAATTVQAAINELDGDIQTLVTNQYTDEKARDAIGAALVAGANVTITVDDPGDTITIAATGGGGGGSAAFTVVEVSLGSSPRQAGKFTISGTGLSVGKPVLIQQAVGPYTGKGTLADEAEMDQVSVTASVTNSTTITAYWTSLYPVRGNFKFQYLVGA